VKAADKIQMMTKALVYEHHGRGELSEFWAHERNFPDQGLAIAREVHVLLRARHSDRSTWSVRRG
jgi:hypothetical protein